MSINTPATPRRSMIINTDIDLGRSCEVSGLLPNLPAIIRRWFSSIVSPTPYPLGCRAYDLGSFDQNCLESGTSGSRQRKVEGKKLQTC